MVKNEKTPMILDLHIPYCVRPERYQDRWFTVGTNEEKNAYLRALKREVLSYEGDLDGYEIRAVRLGGGSATVMSPDGLGDLLRTVREKLPVAKGVEISVDAHPLTICTPALTGIATGHPTRMELMIHSDIQKELDALDCAFTKQNIQNAVLFFGRFHVNNVGFTIHYGIPGQTPASWEQTLHACTIMRPAHITVEALHAEKSAPVAAPSPEERREMYRMACSHLSANGYIQYSANHFALPRHGWLFQLLAMDSPAFLGMGVGARSVYDGYYVRNTSNLKHYIQHGGDFEKTTAQAGQLSSEDAMRAYLFQHLKSTDGFLMSSFTEKFDADLPQKAAAYLEDLVQKDFVTSENGRYAPTAEGLFAQCEGSFSSY